MWKYGSKAMESSEFLLHSALIEMMEYNDDIFAAGINTQLSIETISDRRTDVRTLVIFLEIAYLFIAFC